MSGNAFLLLELFLLGHPRGEGTAAELLEERLALFWGGQWSTLWAFARSCRQPPPSSERQCSDKQRAARVQTLGANGEESRALAAATSQKLAPRTQETLRKTRECFPHGNVGSSMNATDSSNSSSNSNNNLPGPPSAELLDEVTAEVEKLLKKPPKLTAPGLLGTRLEHLSMLC